MMGIERCKPVRYLVKEWESFHLREATKVHVAPLLLHVNHTAERAFKFLNLLLFGIGVQNIIQQTLFSQFLFVSLLHFLLILEQFGHNLLLDGVTIFIGTHTIENLLLQLYQFLHVVRVLQSLLNQHAYFREELFLYVVID